MAEVPYTQEAAAFGGGKTTLVVWRGLTGGDTGKAYYPALGVRAVEMSGDFGTGAVELEGALSAEGWATLHDGIGIPLVRRKKHLSTVAQQPYKVRPVAREGVKSVDVWLLVPIA